MEIQQEILTRIIEKGVQAPSGDNAQPWKFEIKEHVIRLINVPAKDTSPFNFEQVSNHIALGAALENMRIAAEAEGYSVNVRLFPDAVDDLIVAEIELQPAESSENSLAAFIDVRASNRKRYFLKEIEIEKIQALQETTDGTSGRVVLVTEKSTVARIAHLVSAGEKIALENQAIHAFLFDHVTWSEKEEKERHGFYIKTFEFKPPQEFLFKLFRNWNTLKLFHPLGITDFIAKDMEGVYGSSAAFGAIIMPDTLPKEFVQAGRILERVWLTATKLGLSLQPTTSIHLLSLPIRKHASTLTSEHQKLVTDRYADLEKEFSVVPGETIAFLFRLGYASAPSGRTTRAAPIISHV